jgi:phosphohistidine swiveling domain-containing protein
MAHVVPLGEFAGDGWYPGYRPERFAMPYVIDPPGPFRKCDEKNFWYLDFHWSRGLTPLAATLWSSDGYCWGSQHAAESLPLPTSHGIATRFAGTHLYSSAIPETDPKEIHARAHRLSAKLPHFVENFQQIWASERDRLEVGWNHFQSIELTKVPTRQFPDLLTQARGYHKLAMEIHFEVAYQLLTNFVGFHAACIDMGINPAEIGKFLQGEDTKIMETDRELYKLAIKARRTGLSHVFTANEPPRLREALSRHGGPASAWLTEFDDFLNVYGWRQEAACDVGLPSWIEDNRIPLGLIKTFLTSNEDHDFEAAALNAIGEREAAIDAARSRLTKEDQAVFDAGLASNRAANFPWWQDDHNYYIDLRVMLPLRRVCQELASRVGADHKDDMFYLFWPELLDVAGGKPYNGLSGMVRDRRDYFDHWQAKRSTMPRALGTIPDAVADPVLIEILGLNPVSISAVRNPAAAITTTLSGLPASKGVARGIARVLQSSDDMQRLEPGSILVCESTSPNWTPAFGAIAGAVCDSGGLLSHAAIVGREYGVPTVTAVGVATLAIADGDEIEVDGTSGKVTIMKKAGRSSTPPQCAGTADQGASLLGHLGTAGSATYLP